MEKGGDIDVEKTFVKFKISIGLEVVFGELERENEFCGAQAFEFVDFGQAELC